jgi:hypothetical protein
VNRAREIFDDMACVARTRGSAGALAESLAGLARLEWLAGNSTAAERAAREALDRAIAVDNRDAVASCRAVLGFAAEQRRDAPGAHAWHAQALEAARATGDARRLALALEGLAGVALLERDGQRVGRLLGAADALRRSPGRAAGWAFAPCGRRDVERIVRGATDAIGAEAVAVAFADGAADADAVVAAAATPVPQ